MTTAALAPQETYNGNGVTTVFAAGFRFLPGTLIVDLISGDGVVVRQTPGSHYSVTGGSTDAGGSVTMVTPPSSGWRLRIRRGTPRSQSTDYETNDNFPASSHEAALDRAMLIDQEQDVRLDDLARRAPLAPEGEAAPPFGSLSDLQEGDVLTFRGGKLQRHDRAAFAGQFFAGGADGRLIPASGTGADSGLRPDLTSTDPGKGAALVGLPQGGTVAAAIRWVFPESFGAVGDGVTDDSAAIQAAIDYLASIGGGKLLIQGTYLCGGILIVNENIVVEGNSRCNKLIIKSGTTGFTIKEDWVHFRHLNVVSQGTKNDGLGTNGILYAKDAGSIGHVYNYDLNVEGFSGFGVQYNNALDLTMISCFHRFCTTGLRFGRNGTGGADFSTTTRLINVYVIGCTDYGIDAAHVYRSEFNVIAEWNGVGIRNVTGDITLNRCYFENNVTAGAQLTDTGGQDINNYSHPSAGVNTVTRTRVGGGNLDYYTAGQASGDRWTKRLGLQTAWGRDTRWLTGVGTTANIGLKYGAAIVPRVYGRDILDQTAWTNETTSEFMGWSVANSGYAIIHAASGIRGMRQSVDLDETKTYIVDFAATNVAGTAIATVQVDGVAVTPGVPFTVSGTGNKVVRCFASQAGASENYVNVFRLHEALEDQSLIAKTADRLSRAPTQRDGMRGAALPEGKFATAELFTFDNPTPGGPVFAVRIGSSWYPISCGSDPL